MIKIPYTDIIAKIKTTKGLTDDEVEEKIKEKLDKLSGLISRDGAAHIVANELGVKLIENSGKIKDIYPGMRNIQVAGRVTQVYELKEFPRQDGTTGKVGNFIIGDETGIIRIVGWGNQAELVSQVSEGTIVKITGAFSKEGLKGSAEIHLNDVSKVAINPAGIAIEEVKSRNTYKKVNELKDGDENIELKGTIVDVYEPRYFEVCPECSSRLKELDGTWACDTHGAVKPEYSFVVNVVLDDGSDSIRIVLFRTQAERLFSKTREQMLAYKDNIEQFMSQKDALLGEQFRILGKVKHNAFFDRTEFVSQLVFPLK